MARDRERGDEMGEVVIRGCDCEVEDVDIAVNIFLGLEGWDGRCMGTIVVVKKSTVYSCCGRGGRGVVVSQGAGTNR